ncbi:MAG: hypothetical protein OK457_00175 [Thaumarchaeota archaeon]|nr:hypothetical protein [Nitrososphaerota archaeon]
MKRKKNEYKYRYNRRKLGLCDCGRKPLKNLRLCKVCREANALRRKEYLKKGLCYCSRPIDVQGFKKCSICRKQTNIKNRQIKLEVVKEYGGKCQCPGGCDVTNPDWLSMDHINGGGVAHRKELKVIGLDFYRWLKKHKFPKKNFRLLCYNCNLSRGHLGRCPHEEK